MPAATNRIVAAGQMRSDLRRTADALASATRLSTIDAPLSVPWGRMLLATVDERRELVYVLDRTYSAVRVVGFVGGYQRDFGGPGQGPEEFQAVVGLASLREGYLAVAQRSGIIKLISGDDGRFVQQYQASPGLDALCSIGDQLFVRAFAIRGESIVEVIDTNSDRRSRLGSASYATTDPLVRAFMEMGPLACSDGTTPMVVLGFRNLPYLRGYALDGSLVWTTYLDELTMAGVRGVENGTRAGVTWGDEGAVVTNIATMSHQRIVVQVVQKGRRTTSGTIPVLGLDSYLLDAKSGEGAYLGRSLPSILIVAPDGFIGVETTEDFNPRLVRYAF